MALSLTAPRQSQTIKALHEVSNVLKVGVGRAPVRVIAELAGNGPQRARWLGLLFLVCFAFLGKRYWFRVPFRGILLATVFYVSALVIAAA
jgi:hypothetical protein